MQETIKPSDIPSPSIQGEVAIAILAASNVSRQSGKFYRLGANENGRA
jgi:hypothetical protein